MKVEHDSRGVQLALYNLRTFPASIILVRCAPSEIFPATIPDLSVPQIRISGCLAAENHDIIEKQSTLRHLLRHAKSMSFGCNTGDHLMVAKSFDQSGDNAVSFERGDGCYAVEEFHSTHATPFTVQRRHGPHGEVPRKQAYTLIGTTAPPIPGQCFA